MNALIYTLRYINPTPPVAPSPPSPPAQLTMEYERPLSMNWPATPTGGSPVRSRVTEIHLPRRLFGPAAKKGMLRVRVGGGEVGEWTYDSLVRILALDTKRRRLIFTK